MAHLAKATGFDRARNYAQVLRHADIAITKLNQLNDRPLEELSEAMRCKFYSLNVIGRKGEALECAKGWYCLWLKKHTHPPAIDAGFALIESCIHNNEFFDAVLYARTLWETLTLIRDSHIPDNKRELYIAQGAKFLAKALFALAQSGGMPAEEQQATGVEAIMLARRALETSTQVHGAESSQVGEDLATLASILDYFNHVDDDEIPRLFGRAKAIYSRQHGILSPNVATCEKNLGIHYGRRADRAQDAHDLDRFVTNLELALPLFREAARIYRIANRVDAAAEASRYAAREEKRLQIATAAKRELLQQVPASRR